MAMYDVRGGGKRAGWLEGWIRSGEGGEGTLLVREREVR